jgi:hypothetical protein
MGPKNIREGKVVDADGTPVLLSEHVARRMRFIVCNSVDVATLLLLGKVPGPQPLPFHQGLFESKEMLTVMPVQGKERIEYLVRVVETKLIECPSSMPMPMPIHGGNKVSSRVDGYWGNMRALLHVILDMGRSPRAHQPACMV